MCGATHPHTACQLGAARIVYRFHPFFDRQVSVLRTIRLGDEPAVVVRVEALDADPGSEDSQLRISVPCWMLDEAACAKVVVGDVPRIEVDALMRLRRFLDQLGKTSGGEPSVSGVMMAKGDRHEFPATTQATHRDAPSEAADV